MTDSIHFQFIFEDPFEQKRALYANSMYSKVVRIVPSVELPENLMTHTPPTPQHYAHIFTLHATLRMLRIFYIFKAIER